MRKRFQFGIFLMVLAVCLAESSGAYATPSSPSVEYQTIEEAEAARKSPEPEEDVNEEVDVRIMNGHHFEQFSSDEQKAIVKYLIDENIAKVPGYKRATRVERKKLLDHWTSPIVVARVTKDILGRFNSGRAKKSVYVIELVQELMRHPPAKK